MASNNQDTTSGLSNPQSSPSATTKSLEIIWKRINRHGRYYDKPMKYTEFAAAIDNLIRKERSQAIASYKKVLAEEARLKGGIDGK